MRKVFVLVALIVFFVIAGMFWWNNGIGSVDPKDKSSQIFVIAPGHGVREIANELKSKNLIKDPIVFFLFVKNSGIDKKIQAGDFRLSPSMNASALADALTHGAIDIWITVPEGQRGEEIADTLKKKILTYQESWRSILNANEGYLFPDTYLIPKNADINSIVSLMKNNFDTKIKSINLSKDNLELRKIIIIASLIEREALRNDEKPIIASVIFNRLNQGMSLDIDATLQYIKGGNNSGKWWSIPTVEDKKINSPYNTYANVGLPPNPISNPGIEAIKAALEPNKTDYYYYIHDKERNIRFAKTLEGHNENIRKYGVN